VIRTSCETHQIILLSSLVSYPPPSFAIALSTLAHPFSAACFSLVARLSSPVASWSGSNDEVERLGEKGKEDVEAGSGSPCVSRGTVGRFKSSWAILESGGSCWLKDKVDFTSFSFLDLNLNTRLSRIACLVSRSYLLSSDVCSAASEGCSRSSLDIKGEFLSYSLYASGLTFVEGTGDCGCQAYIGVCRGARRFLVRSFAIAGDVGRR